MFFSFFSPAPRIPLQAKTIVVKEDEAVPQQFTTGQNSATLKSSPGPSTLISSWLQTNTSTGWDISPTQPSLSSAPLIQSDFLSKTRPVPSEHSKSGNVQHFSSLVHCQVSQAFLFPIVLVPLSHC